MDPLFLSRVGSLIKVIWTTAISVEIHVKAHSHTHGPQTYVRRLWFIVSVNLGYSFSVHA